jgi:ABC-type histidine transport system ATPase subunit
LGDIISLGTVKKRCILPEMAVLYLQQQTANIAAFKTDLSLWANVLSFNLPVEAIDPEMVSSSNHAWHLDLVGPSIA